MRTKFTVIGAHPLLFEIRKHLITKKLMELVGPTDDPDFVIIGADNGPVTNLVLDLPKLWEAMAALSRSAPIILLSSSSVYSDRTEGGLVSEVTPMSENRPAVVSSVDPQAARTLYPLLVENTVLTRFKRVIVLRTFECYGPGLAHGTIPRLCAAALKEQPLEIENPGYQTRTFLHIDDFFTAFDKLVPKFLAGATGVYNIGSAEEISLRRLADSVWGLTQPTKGATVLELVQPEGQQVWWVRPDITRISVLLNWHPKITLRKGLWMLINNTAAVV